MDMNTIHRIGMCLTVLLCTACGTEKIKNAERVEAFPDIYPDYVGVTIPATLSPLPFSMTDSTCRKLDVVFRGADGQEIHTQGAAVTDIPPERWRRLLAGNVGDSLSVRVFAKFADGWKSYRPFGIYISADAIDYGLNYRLIAPGYEVYSKMGIYERDLSSFEERVLIENTQFEGCVNCHSYNRCRPTDLSLHIRGAHGATLLQKDGQMKAYDTATDSTLALCVYPYWHPSGNYIAYSTNHTRQGFHIQQDKLIEVFDLASDLQVYDIRTNELVTVPHLKRDSVWETFPAFSPDGRSLYFCAAAARPIPTEVKEVRYNLCRVDFDPGTCAFGAKIDTLIHAESAGKSVSFPRPSYDGRYLLYTLADYGQFSVWHHEADLWMLDLQTGENRRLDEVNSCDTESYHSWSSNSRWFVFGSRRDDGLHTRAYIAHCDTDGKIGKPFMLPQPNPKHYYDNHFRSYNVLEFVCDPVSFDRLAAEKLIETKDRVQMKYRQGEVR